MMKINTACEVLKYWSSIDLFSESFDIITYNML